jgi:hypothetical protein
MRREWSIQVLQREVALISGVVHDIDGKGGGYKEVSNLTCHSLGGSEGHVLV